MLRVLEAFSGIGAQRKALENIGVPHEVVAISEIDKYAIQSYEAMHGETFNLGDISKVKVEDIPDCDLFTYSFPCTDISLSGLQHGLDEGSGTRSSLLWECKRVIENKKPKYLMLENVRNLIGKKHKANFDKWLEWLESQGYTSYYEILNAKDYRIPQNRERVFVISILGEHKPFVFPPKEELTIKLKDLLEDNVDEKFYLKDDKVKQLLANKNKNYTEKEVVTMNWNEVKDKADISQTLMARDYKGFCNQDMRGVIEPKIIQIGNIAEEKNFKNPQVGRVYSSEGLSPTLNTCGGGGHEPKILTDETVTIPIRNATKKGYLEATVGDGVDLAYPESKTRRGRVQKDMANTLTTNDTKGVVIAAMRGRYTDDTNSETEQKLEINNRGVSNTLTTVQKDNLVLENNIDDTIEFDMPRIRKLTPREYWRLMGFDDEDFDKAVEAGLSNSQLYKQAGNSIVVNVLEAIFKNLFLGEDNE